MASIKAFSSKDYLLTEGHENVFYDAFSKVEVFLFPSEINFSVSAINCKAEKITEQSLAYFLIETKKIARDGEYGALA